MKMRETLTSSLLCCLRTEYHRLAVPDKYRRVLPVCSKRVKFDHTSFIKFMARVSLIVHTKIEGYIRLSDTEDKRDLLRERLVRRG